MNKVAVWFAFIILTGVAGAMCLALGSAGMASALFVGATVELLALLLFSAIRFVSRRVAS